MSTTAELILDAKSDLGEGPVWDHENNVLYWVNITAGEVHTYDPATGDDRVVDCGQPVGTVVGRESGGLMVAAAGGFACLDIDSGRLEIVANPEADSPDMRFNDGKCDPAGRFWAGSLHKGEDTPVGSLYMLNTDMSVYTGIDGGITIANGIVWTSDRSTMYYIDTPTQRVDAFDYDDATGQITNRREAFPVPEANGWPDGMAIDSEDKVWVAHWGGWNVIRYDPATGEELLRIDVPASQTTACAFGGPELKHLYITSAAYGLDDAAHQKEPHAGGLFMIEVDVPGVPSPKFAG
jgi:sugar lactone lactonase YvrE